MRRSRAGAAVSAGSDRIAARWSSSALLRGLVRQPCADQRRCSVRTKSRPLRRRRNSSLAWAWQSQTWTPRAQVDVDRLAAGALDADRAHLALRRHPSGLVQRRRHSSIIRVPGRAVCHDTVPTQRRRGRCGASRSVRSGTLGHALSVDDRMSTGEGATPADHVQDRPPQEGRILDATGRSACDPPNDRRSLGQLAHHHAGDPAYIPRRRAGRRPASARSAGWTTMAMAPTTSHGRLRLGAAGSQRKNSAIAPSNSTTGPTKDERDREDQRLDRDHTGGDEGDGAARFGAARCLFVGHDRISAAPGSLLQRQILEQHAGRGVALAGRHQRDRVRRGGVDDQMRILDVVGMQLHARRAPAAAGSGRRARGRRACAPATPAGRRDAGAARRRSSRPAPRGRRARR